jgi:hypothetical protein
MAPGRLDESAARRWEPSGRAPPATIRRAQGRPWLTLPRAARNRMAAGPNRCRSGADPARAAGRHFIRFTRDDYLGFNQVVQAGCFGPQLGAVRAPLLLTPNRRSSSPGTAKTTATRHSAAAGQCSSNPTNSAAALPASRDDSSFVAVGQYKSEGSANKLGATDTRLKGMPVTTTRAA